MNNTFELGRSIAQLVPSHISTERQQPKEIITNKIVITIVIIAIVKISVLILLI